MYNIEYTEGFLKQAKQCKKRGYNMLFCFCNTHRYLSTALHHARTLPIRNCLK